LIAKKGRKNTRYGKEFKNKVLMEYTSGASALGLGAKYNISVSTIYQWRKKQLVEKATKKEPVNGEIIRDPPIVKKTNGEKQTILPTKVFMQNSSRYIISLDFNRRRDVLREIETIADINE